MATKARSERSRWVTIYTLPEPNTSNADGFAKQKHNELHAVVAAFEKAGRVVRVVPGNYGTSLEFKARKA